MVSSVTVFAGDLEDLKAASLRYVTAMEGVLALSDDSDCSETIAKANEDAAAKVDYYRAARQAMPDLLQMAKGDPYGDELTRIFQDFGENRDQKASGMLEAKLNLCPKSDQRDEAHLAVERAQQIAEQFIKDFGRLEGA
jgi:hypothetical protein